MKAAIGLAPVDRRGPGMQVVVQPCQTLQTGHAWQLTRTVSSVRAIDRVEPPSAASKMTLARNTIALFRIRSSRGDL
jgi:hypothetical protein